MQRRPHRRSFNAAGHAHELTFSCLHRFPFLKAERTCQWLSEAIDRARLDLHFDLWAFVFMPDHVHLIVRPHSSDYDIAQFLRQIKQPVARRAVAFLRTHAPDWLQRIEVRKGSEVRHQFWQKGGGYDRNIMEGKTLLKMIDYLHLNPVRKALVAEARLYRWSSAAHYEGSECPLRIDPIPAEWLMDG